jgi:ammonium transporter Rh
MWQDIHVMVFVGFGFLMVFLKTHSWSSIGFNFLIAAWAIQCTILFYGFWAQVLKKGIVHKININMPMIIMGDFGAASCLITMGAVLGKTTLPQLFTLITIETIFYCLNLAICLDKLGIADIGGAITIHMFGAYFGLTATYFFQPKKALEDKLNQCKGNYNSQLIAMVGTLFLFMYWPSFNGALAVGMAQQRSVVNTLLSITGSALVSVYVSRALIGKIDMEVLLNSTLAGGVMMGASCDLITNGGFAMLAGCIAGGISTLGYLKLNHFTRDKLGLHDTCGVQFLHGIPGLLGGFTSVICCAAMEYNFGSYAQMELVHPHLHGRTGAKQANYNLACMAITMGIAIGSGAIAGFIASRLPHPEKLFDDSITFEHCEFGDDTAKFNTGHASAGSIELKSNPMH